MKQIIYLIVAVVLLGVGFNSCSEDSLDPTLTTKKDMLTSIKTVKDLRSVSLSAYDRMTQTGYYGRNYIIYGELMSDNCTANGNSGRFLEIAGMNMGSDLGDANTTWEDIYEVIASANLVIQSDVEGDLDEIDYIKGQMLAVRALAHFDLLRFFGQQNITGGTAGIPYLKKYNADISDFSDADRYPTRLTVDQVKVELYADIESAIEKMAGTTSGNGVTMDLYGAQALKARVAQYFGDWDKVIDASEVIINSGLYDIVAPADYVKSWKEKGGANTIFELTFTNTDNRGINGLAYIYRGKNYGDISVMNDLVGIFDATDIRLNSTVIQKNKSQVDTEVDFIGVGAQSSYMRNNGKYPSSETYDDNVDVFRYEEVILNYAEALMEEGTTGIGANDALYFLNLIPEQRGLGAGYYAVANQDNILLERRKELCFEGFRFHDLARTGRDIPGVTGSKHDEITYGSFKYALPIPENELNSNKNMVQNLGY